MKKIVLIACFGALHALSINKPVCIFTGNAQEENIFHLPYITKDKDELVLCLKQQGRYKQMLASLRQPWQKWSKASVISNWQPNFSHLFVDRINSENFGIYFSNGRKKSASIYGVLCDAQGNFYPQKTYLTCQNGVQLLALSLGFEDTPNFLITSKVLDPMNGKDETSMFLHNYEMKHLDNQDYEIANGRLFEDECYLDVSKQGHGFFIYLKSDEIFEQKIAHFKKEGEKTVLAANHYDIDKLVFHEKDHRLESFSYIADGQNFCVISKIDGKWENTFKIPIHPMKVPVFKLGYLSSKKQVLCLFEQCFDGVDITLITKDEEPIKAKFLLSNATECQLEFAYLSSGVVILILENGLLNYICFDENTKTWSDKKPLTEGIHNIKSFSLYQTNEQKILLSFLCEQDNLSHVQLIEITP